MQSVEPDSDLVWGLLAGTVNEADGSRVSDSIEGCHLPFRPAAGNGTQSSASQIAEEDSADVGVGGKMVSIATTNENGVAQFGSFPVNLSSAQEASIRCMRTLAPASEVRARFHDEAGKLICDTGLVPLTDEGWVCLNSVSTSGGGALLSSKLWSWANDFDNGWSIFFDLKERCGEKTVLSYVRIVRSSAQAASTNNDAGTEKQVCSSPHKTRDEDCLDCTDVDALGDLNVRSFGVFSKLALRCPTRDALQKMLLQDEHKWPKGLLDPSWWASMARGLTLHDKCSLCGKITIDSNHQNSVRSQLEHVGHSQFQSLRWDEVGISMHAIVETIDALRENGLPPAFIFMYDQPWMLCEQLFEAMAGVLSCERVEMDTSFFAWALQREGEGETVGNNFGRPHRDYKYEDCHTPDGKYSVLTVWIPLVPVSINSGCMYVVPANHDPLFADSKSSNHMQPEKEMPWPYIRPLPCSAGDVLMWRGNLIHWGSAYTAKEEQPRRSIGTAFMLPSESSKTHADKTDTLSKDEIRAGLDLPTRLRLVMKALLRYHHWHPSFLGSEALEKCFNDIGNN